MGRDDLRTHVSAIQSRRGTEGRGKTVTGARGVRPEFEEGVEVQENGDDFATREVQVGIVKTPSLANR